jgi:mannose-1-phosphate guanylyltransferase/phosphomannomutase
MIRQVVIIAGGKGTRMGVSAETPKSLLLIDGKSILERQIEFFIKNGFDKFLILLGYKSEQVISYIQEVSKHLQIKIDYEIEDLPLGTGGALLNAFPSLEDEFVLILGDIIINTNIKDLVYALKDGLNDLAMFYHPSHHPEDSDLLLLDDSQKISKIFTKPRDEGLYRNHGNAGCYAIKKYVLEKFMRNNQIISKIDLDRELLPQIIDNGFVAQGVRSHGFIRDCGTQDRLKYVNKNWHQIKNATFTKPAIFIDRDGTLNKLNGFITKLDQINIFDDASYFISEINKLNYWVIVITNQPVIARGEVTTDMLDKFHAKIEENVSEKGGIIDDFFYCPHHPNKGFKGEISNLKIECKCRKPEVGLILEACEKYPIDMANSWMIGDTWRDFELANNSGLKFIQIIDNDLNETSLGGRVANNLVGALKIIKQESFD